MISEEPDYAGRACRPAFHIQRSHLFSAIISSPPLSLLRCYLFSAVISSPLLFLPRSHLPFAVILSTLAAPPRGTPLEDLRQEPAQIRSRRRFHRTLSTKRRAPIH